MSSWKFCLRLNLSKQAVPTIKLAFTQGCTTRKGLNTSKQFWFREFLGKKHKKKTKKTAKQKIYWSASIWQLSVVYWNFFKRPETFATPPPPQKKINKWTKFLLEILYRRLGSLEKKNKIKSWKKYIKIRFEYKTVSKTIVWFMTRDVFVFGITSKISKIK